MAEKTINTRIIMKHATESEWSKVSDFTPKLGEIIVYDKDAIYSYERMKVGDGVSKISSLPFITDAALAKANTALETANTVSGQLGNYLPTAGGTISGTLYVNKDLISQQVIYCMSNSNPKLTFRNADNSKILTSLVSASTGDFANLFLYVNSANDNAAEFIFTKDGKFNAPNDINTNGGMYTKKRIYCGTDYYPGITFEDASSRALAQFVANTSSGGYSDAIIATNSDAGWKYFIFGKNGTLTVPNSLNLGSPLTVTNGGTGATSAASALANLGAASSTLVRGQMKTFTIAGDKDHYYPVVFNASSEYFVNRIAITRGYNDTAPDDWGTDTNHKGGLTFQFQWNGDNYWGGNSASTSLKVETLLESYCKMVGGMKLSVSGVVVWLRGGSALYKVLNEMGSAMSITPYYDTFTDIAGNSFSVRTYDASVVNNEIQQRLVFYPLTGGNLLGHLVASGKVSGTQLYSETNANPGLYFYNKNQYELGSIYSASNAGEYASIVIKANSSSSESAYFGFWNNGTFTSPGKIYSVSNTNPQIVLTNASTAYLTSLHVDTSDGGYGNAVLSVYNSASDVKQFFFRKNGTFTTPGSATFDGHTYAKGQIYSNTDKWPGIFLRNSSNQELADFYIDTSTGAFSFAALRVFSAASTSTSFLFGNTGNLTVPGTVFMGTALSISNGGTGSTTAAGALTNLGALPLTGGTISRDLTVNGNIFAGDDDFVQIYQDAYYDGQTGVVSIGNANYGDWKRVSLDSLGCLRLETSMVYSDGDSVIYSSTEPTAPSGLYKGMIWLKPV